MWYNTRDNLCEDCPVSHEENLNAQETVMKEGNLETEEQFEQDSIVDAWKEYGGKYNVFVPEEQPTPEGAAWDRPLPERLPDGSLDPQYLKHWRVFHYTRAFLRERYAEYGILRGASLIFDCLVPIFQQPLSIDESKRKAYGLPKKGDPSRWYTAAIKMTISGSGEVGFMCQSRECMRTKCKLNPRNDKRISPCDLYSLIQIFHGHRSVATAKKIVSDRFHLQIGKFGFQGVEEKSATKRFAVPKWEIQSLIERFSGMRRQQIPSLVQDAEELIRSCQLVELDHARVFSNYFAFLWPQILENKLLRTINGPAIRLYLWLLVEQEERARRNVFSMELTDAEVAGAHKASPQTVGRYRQELEKTGLLKVKGGVWTVGYTAKSQWNVK